MLVPIFGSCPTYLSREQDAARRLILGEVNHAGLEWRSLGRTDFPTRTPLREVFVLARHCAGGVILGFSQTEVSAGVKKKGTPEEERVSGRIGIPTPWNHLEAGILFALRVPLLVFREEHVAGGVFDVGNTDLFVHPMPMGRLSAAAKSSLREVVRKWANDVHGRYYAE
jgi:hypothetical protein